jgi:hypothetical protein
MLNTFDRLIGILGTTEDSEPFLSFLAQFDEKPVLNVHRQLKDYSFAESGFMIMILKDSQDERWKAMSFLLHFLAAPTRSGYIKPCAIELPSKISVKDRRKQIIEKLKNSGFRPLGTDLIPGIETEHGHRTDNWDEYQLSPKLTITVVSDSQTGRLCSISGSNTQWTTSPNEA